MRRTWANLRAGLLPAWVVWMLFGLAVAVYGLLIVMEARSERFAGYEWSGFWVFVFPLGYFILGRHGLNETAPKPFSFLLPGYRESWRRSSPSRVIRWGVAFSLYAFSKSWQRLLFFWEIRRVWSNLRAGLALPEPLPPRPGILEMSVSTAGGFLAGIAFCLFWTNLSLVHFRRKWLEAPFTILGAATGYGVMLFADTRHPFVAWSILIPLSAFYCAYFWVRLQDDDWVKSGHRAIIVAATEGFRKIAIPVRPHHRVEELFLGQMRKTAAKSVGRSVRAWLYRTCGLLLPHWRWIAIPLLVGVLIQGYMSRSLVGLALLFLSGLVAASARPDISSMLLPEGRKRKYDLAVVAAALTTLLLLAVDITLIGLSWLLAALIPPISFGSHHWRYAGIPVGTLLLVCLPVPWVFLLGPTRHRVPIIRAAILVVVAFLSLVEVLLGSSGLRHNPMLLPVLLVCGWALFPLGLWIAYQRWDLVGQRAAKSD